MKTLNLKTLVGATAATICTCFIAGSPVQAFGFTELNSDWHVVKDSFNDRTQAGIVGS